MRVAIQKLFDERAPATMQMSRDEATRTIAYQLEMELMNGMPVEVPADWWEAIKERWFFKWMLKRWPVKMRQIDTCLRPITDDDVLAWLGENRGEYFFKNYYITVEKR